MHGWWFLISLFLTAASAHAGDGPAKMAASPFFTGEWHVEWCDKNEPTRDCGGFTASLMQDGERISGVGAGATIGLGRLDECGAIEGIAVDDKAYLLVRSARMGTLFLVDAQRVGDDLSWKVRETVAEGSAGDRDVVARDAVLKRVESEASLIESCKEAR